MVDNDELDRLVGLLRPVRRRRPAAEAVALALLGGLELALFLGFGAARPDMPVAMVAPSFWWKLASLGVLVLLATATALASFDPAASPRRGLRRLAAAAAVALAAGWALDVAQGGGPDLARLDWHDGMVCVAKMVALAMPAAAGLALLMRRGAPTDPAGTALAAGVAAGAWGAFVFLFACPFDDPFYLAVWYTVGCGVVTLLCRLALPRLTRW